MRLLFFTLFVFAGQFCVAQVHYMPFELERKDATTYSQYLENLNTEFNTELEALEYYFLAYEIQRAQNPAEYFPPTDGERILAGNYLKKNHPEGSGMALVNFLETNGNIESCGALIDRQSGYSLLLPYRFMAAFILNKKDVKSKYLIEMEREGMLSEVTKGFGENALISTGTTRIVATQGMQDLIAIEYALQSQNKEMQLLNLFAENCTAFTGPTVHEEIKDSSKLIWLSPVISREMLFENKPFLSQAGIGFLYARGPFADNSFLQNILIETGNSFHGLDASPRSNADEGLISAYRYFAEAYSDYSNLGLDKKASRRSKEINRYIQNQIK